MENVVPVDNIFWGHDLNVSSWICQAENIKIMVTNKNIKMEIMAGFFLRPHCEESAHLVLYFTMCIGQ